MGRGCVYGEGVVKVGGGRGRGLWGENGGGVVLCGLLFSFCCVFVLGCVQIIMPEHLCASLRNNKRTLYLVCGYTTDHT